jgi:hypothetical protein
MTLTTKMIWSMIVHLRLQEILDMKPCLRADASFWRMRNEFTTFSKRSSRRERETSHVR